MNRLHIIEKQPNQTWESWFNKRPLGTVIIIPWDWCYDTARKTLNGFVGTGHFKKKSAAGVDTYTRTNKPFKRINSDRQEKN
jgi:hypothetical protein